MEPTPEQTAFMAKNWRDLIRPRMLEIEERSETYGKFSCEPLERGFGTTLGTGLRRVLLSSLQGAAITARSSVEGALHEFSSLPGVVEDVTDIILNLKETLLKVEADKTYTVRLDKHGPGRGAGQGPDAARRRHGAQPEPPHLHAVEGRQDRV
jgi:DNA-directed RNA polymerase subunit alpha